MATTTTRRPLATRRWTRDAVRERYVRARSGLEAMGPLVGGVALAGALGYGMIQALATPPGRRDAGGELLVSFPSAQEEGGVEEGSKGEAFEWKEEVADAEGSVAMGASLSEETTEGLVEASERVAKEDVELDGSQGIVEREVDVPVAAAGGTVPASVEASASKEEVVLAEEEMETSASEISEVEPEAILRVPDVLAQLQAKAQEAAAELEAKRAEAAEAARQRKEEEEAARLVEQAERQKEQARLEKEKKKQEAVAKKQREAEERRERNQALQERRKAEAEDRRKAAEQSRQRAAAEREERRAAAAEAREAVRSSRTQRGTSRQGTQRGTQKTAGTMSGTIQGIARGGTIRGSGTMFGTVSSRRTMDLGEDATLDERAEAARAAADAAARRAEAAARSVDGLLASILPPVKKAAEEKAERLSLEAEELEAEARKLEAQLQGGGAGRRAAIAIGTAGVLGGIGYVIVQALSSAPRVSVRSTSKRSDSAKVTKEKPLPPSEVKIDLENPLDAYDALTGN